MWPILEQKRCEIQPQPFTSLSTTITTVMPANNAFRTPCVLVQTLAGALHDFEPQKIGSTTVFDAAFSPAPKKLQECSKSPILSKKQPFALS